MIVKVPSLSDIETPERRSYTRRFCEAQKVAMAALRRLPAFAEAVSSLRQSGNFTIDWPTGLREAVQNGQATWKRFDDGNFSAVIRDSANKDIIKHLKLRPEDFPSDALRAFSDMALQRALADVSQQIEELGVKVGQVLIGGSADRMGRVVAARQVYQQSLVANSEERRRQLTAAAIQTSAEARAILLTHIQMRVEALEAPTALGGWLKSTPLKPTQSEKLAAELVELTSEFKAALEATQLMGQIHAEAGEDAMARVAVKQLNDSLSQLVPRFASLLRLAPREHVHQAEKLWAGVQTRLMPASVAAQQLLSASTLCFEVDDETDGESTK